MQSGSLSKNNKKLQMAMKISISVVASFAFGALFGEARSSRLQASQIAAIKEVDTVSRPIFSVSGHLFFKEDLPIEKQTEVEAIYQRAKKDVYDALKADLASLPSKSNRDLSELSKETIKKKLAEKAKESPASVSKEEIEEFLKTSGLEAEHGREKALSIAEDYLKEVKRNRVLQESRLHESIIFF
jgi:hypothetical protein